MRDNSKTNKLTKTLFVIYIIALFWIIIFKFDIPFSKLSYLRSINLVPFSDSLIVNNKLNFSELLMNAVIFIPLGIYCGVLFNGRTIGRKIFIIFIISLICEVFQFILGVGASDITDIINNLLGGITGLVIYKIIEKMMKKNDKAQRLINVFATIGTVLIVLLLSVLVIYNL